MHITFRQGYELANRANATPSIMPHLVTPVTCLLLIFLIFFKMSRECVLMSKITGVFDWKETTIEPLDSRVRVS
jgi:hypothetical protein